MRSNNSFNFLLGCIKRIVVSTTKVQVAFRMKLNEDLFVLHTIEVKMVLGAEVKQNVLLKWK